MLRQAQHERIWGLHDLVPHPNTPPRLVEAVQVQILGFDQQSLALEFSVRGRATLVFPGSSAKPGRMNELWKTTCFEAFLREAGAEHYAEFNFSPSGDWAAYQFERYREGMNDLVLRLDPEVIVFEPSGPPPTRVRAMLNRLIGRRPPPPDLPDDVHVSAEFDPSPFLTGSIRLNLTAVIEEVDGTKSYWALAHPDGPPDFHDPACFVLELPAAG